MTPASLTPAQQRLVEDNIRLAYRYVGRNLSYCLACCRGDLDEAHSRALHGLCEAARRYDPSRARFSTYAYMWIRQRIQGNRRISDVMERMVRQRNDVRDEEPTVTNDAIERVDIEDFAEWVECQLEQRDLDVVHYKRDGWTNVQVGREYGVTRGVIGGVLQRVRRNLNKKLEAV